MIEVTGTEISSDKIFVKNIFGKEMWYRIPEYQRPYVWEDEQVIAFLEDISQAGILMPNSQYFLGSVVLHTRTVVVDGLTFDEHDLLDGQQRLTTLFLLHAVIRDLTKNVSRKKGCSESLFQEKNEDDNIPERNRIVFDIRKEVQDFVDQYIKIDGGTQKRKELEILSTESEDVSVRHIAKAILCMSRWIDSKEDEFMDKFYKFLRSNVLLIWVASRELDDAFRMFTVLNDRGVKLRNSDILKAENLKAVNNPAKRKEYAKYWEDLEGQLEEDFDKFLSYLRTILVKEKARLSLLKEFEENVYNPKKLLLEKGSETFEFIKKYEQYYTSINSGNNYDDTNQWLFDNLVTVMDDTLPSDNWIPPLMTFISVFGSDRQSDFLKKLDNKFSTDWITGVSPTKRIDAMNAIIKKIFEISKLDLDVNSKIDILLNDSIFSFDSKELFRQIGEFPVYNRPFTKYILRKVDFILGSKSERKGSPKYISVEHILPQKPGTSSEWIKNFNDEDRKKWTNRLGNLVLISKKKNVTQGNKDFKEKKEKYFKENIETFPNSIRVMQYQKWTIVELESNHSLLLEKLKKYYTTE